MTVRLKNQKKIISKYNDLNPQKEYFVIGIEGNDYRILNEDGRPFLYSNDIFSVSDEKLPENWITEYYDKERYSYPVELNRAGFFEDYFDGNRNAINVFNKFIKQHQ